MSFEFDDAGEVTGFEEEGQELGLVCGVFVEGFDVAVEGWREGEERAEVAEVHDERLEGEM